MEVLPEDYVVRVTASQCSLCLRASENLNYWALGTTFLRGYYSIFKQSPKNIMGFVPFVGSNKAAPVRAISTPTEPLPNDITVTLVDPNADSFGSNIDWIGLVTVATIFLLVAAIIIYRECFQTYQTKDDKEEIKN